MIDNQYLNINNYKAIAIKEGFEIFEADYKDCNINILCLISPWHGSCIFWKEVRKRIELCKF